MGDQFSPLDLTPDEFRRLGHEVVDRIASHLGELRDTPVATPQAIRGLLGQSTMPDAGSDPGEALKALTDLTLENTCLNAHPRMWGYITGSPSPVGALADLVAAAANPNVAGWNGAPIAPEIEHQAVQWISQLLGYSDNASGILTSGGNMSNFIGVLAARKAMTTWYIRQEGIDGHGLVLYATRETHAWIEKAADLFGFGTQAIHYVETDTRQRMEVGSLENHIREDSNAGLNPFLVVGTAGTTSTGAIDPLPAIAKTCQDNNLWFHVDGCYGAPGILAPNASDDLYGLRLADSLAIDARKWLYVPLEAGCTLVRDSQHLTTAFATNPSYYELGDYTWSSPHELDHLYS
jgi:glutamate/tyrosine decarboxylase-like PLP-dependent enzyme